MILEPADLGQVVLSDGLEEHVVQVALGLFGDDELLGADHAVDGVDGFLAGADGVLQQGVADGDVVDRRVHLEDLDGLDLAVLQAEEHLAGDLLVGFHHDLAGGRVDDVFRNDAADHVLDLHVAEGEGLDVVEEREDVRVRLDADGADQGGGGDLALLVHADEERVIQVELELDPGPPVGDHAGEVKFLSVGGDLLLFVFFENHARGAVELTDHDAFDAVDDEGGVGGHERQVADVDFLLGQHLGLAARLLLHEPEPRLQMRGVVGILGEGLFHRITRFREGVMHELHLERLVGARDGEHVLKCRLQSLNGAFSDGDVGLQELLVGAGLHLQQRRQLDDRVDTGE